jgi:Tol biopolymer transport system component
MIREGWERAIVTPDDFANEIVEELSFPAFAPDGNRVAFFSLVKGEHSIWVSTTAGSKPVKLMKGAQMPAWSPDGDWIAFPISVDGRRLLAKTRVGISGAPIVLTKEALAYLPPPQWSNDGNGSHILLQNTVFR